MMVFGSVRIQIQATTGIIIMVVGITQVSQIFLRVKAIPATKTVHPFKALVQLVRLKVQVRLVQDLVAAQKVTVVN